MLLQDLHDSHVCNSLLVAESEEDIWKNESLYRQRLNTTDGKSEEDADRFAHFFEISIFEISVCTPVQGRGGERMLLVFGTDPLMSSLMSQTNVSSCVCTYFHALTQGLKLTSAKHQMLEVFPFAE